MTRVHFPPIISELTNRRKFLMSQGVEMHKNNANGEERSVIIGCFATFYKEMHGVAIIFPSYRCTNYASMLV